MEQITIESIEPIASTSSIPIEAPSSTSLPPSTEAPTDVSTSEPPLGKKAAKRLAKKILWDAGKPERKAKEKLKIAQKKEIKRKLIEDGTIERPVSKKGKLADMGRRAEKFGARIVLDMSFDSLMTEKEIVSIDKQLSFCYNINRNSIAPVNFLITSLNGKLKHRMDTVSKGSYQNWKDVEWWEDSYEKLWEEEAQPIASTSTESDSTLSTSTPNFNPTISPITIGLSKGQNQSRTLKSNVVYLTGDSPNVLTHLSPDETYIVGGIVDKNRHKLLCYNQAEKQGIRHAQLPIGEFLPQMLTRKILTVNQVFDIMVDWCETKDWEASMKRVMPTRKLSSVGKKERRAQKNLPGTTEEEGEGGEGEGEGEDGEDYDDEGDEAGEGGEADIVAEVSTTESGVLGL